ncbi:MAG: hypothetical protein R3C61_02630 [Bacteroidia bacterium]
MAKKGKKNKKQKDEVAALNQAEIGLLIKKIKKQQRKAEEKQKLLSELEALGFDEMLQSLKLRIARLEEKIGEMVS